MGNCFYTEELTIKLRTIEILLEKDLPVPPDLWRFFDRYTAPELEELTQPYT